MEGAYSITLAHKDGKPGLLRFPAFHHEILSQTWVVPAQSMGRIKIIIAEGISHGPPGTTSFEKIRNLVAFSFQHTPLRETYNTRRQMVCSNTITDILEDSGIAWPNPGMFYQALQPECNPLSPRMEKSIDPDAHAHSPRRGVAANRASASAKLDNTAPPPSFSSGMMQSGMTMPPPPFRVDRRQSDPFFPQCSHHDPFSGIGEHVYRRRFLQDSTRGTSSSGDISMQDAPSLKSRSTLGDELMADYIRPLSPLSSYKSYPMNEYPRPISPESHRALSLPALPVAPSPSPPQNRQVSDESLRGPRMQRLFNEVDAQSEHEAQYPEDSQFSEMIDAMSPCKSPGSGYLPPANTRASSAANTPPTATKPSAAAKARALSYSAKNRSVSHTTRDLPPLTHIRTSEIALEPQNKYQRAESCQSEFSDETAAKLQKVVKNPPSTNVKSKKENRASELCHEDAATPRRRVSAGSAPIRDKENLDTLHPSGGDNKRRRRSNNICPGTVLVAQATNKHTPSQEISAIEIGTDSPNKINEIDDLTPEGVFIRAPLGDLNNRA